MYLQNKYTTWYYLIIAQAQKRINLPIFVEKHHIIPKSLGGNNSDDNLVRLTPREHFVCHLLLTKMVTGDAQRKMWFASYLMMRGTKRYKPSGRLYEILKQKMIQSLKERPGPNLGKKLSEEHKKKLSLAQKGIPKGPMSEEHREKLRKPKTEEHKKKLSEVRLGKSWGHKHSEETKQKMSNWQRGIPKPKVTCEHCGKELSLMNYKKWHGDKCVNCGGKSHVK